MALYIPAHLKERIIQADQGGCAYCQTNELNSGMPLTIDHIIPMSRNGETVFENLCLACRSCNQYNADHIHGEDPQTGEIAPLFNPRKDKWGNHFSWSADGTRIEGLTAKGRATVIVLRMNRSGIVGARSRWVIGGWHPPYKI